MVRFSQLVALSDLRLVELQQDCSQVTRVRRQLSAKAPVPPASMFVDMRKLRRIAPIQFVRLSRFSETALHSLIHHNSKALLLLCPAAWPGCACDWNLHRSPNCPAISAFLGAPLLCRDAMCICLFLDSGDMEHTDRCDGGLISIFQCKVCC